MARNLICSDHNDLLAYKRLITFRTCFQEDSIRKFQHPMRGQPYLRGPSWSGGGIPSLARLLQGVGCIYSVAPTARHKNWGEQNPQSHEEDVVTQLQNLLHVIA